MKVISFALAHREPRRDPDELIAEAVEAARAADTAVVVVATTERVESEGFDRKDLRLPGRQDELVRAVAAANPHTVVVVNSGSPVELPWRDEVAAVLLSWFPGQEGGAALADVLLGAHEPGGRLPTTWRLASTTPRSPRSPPTDGELPYSEGVFIGYRAWERSGRTPTYPFGHGLGYTDWTYDEIEVTRHDGPGPHQQLRHPHGPRGRPDLPGPHRPGHHPPARWLAGFASVEAPPGESSRGRHRAPRPRLRDLGREDQRLDAGEGLVRDRGVAARSPTAG